MYANIPGDHLQGFHEVQTMKEDAILWGILPMVDGTIQLSTLSCMIGKNFLSISGQSPLKHIFFIMYLDVPGKDCAWGRLHEIVHSQSREGA